MNKIKLIVTIFTVLGLVIFSAKTFAQQPTPYKTICHHTPGNDVTLEFQNEQSYNGHLGQPHSGSTYDTYGACGSTNTTPTPTISNNENKVNLCHATGSDTNPYISITIAAAAAYNGHYGASHQDGRDIIPPFEFQGSNYSQNWNANGQATHANNCVPTNATPTPTPGGSGVGGSTNSNSSSNTQGASTQSVLGLAATGSGNNPMLSLLQLTAALTLATVGFSLFRRVG